MKKQLIKIIAEYLEKETNVTGEYGSQRIEFGGALNQGHFTHVGFCREVAQDIAATIAPTLEAGAEPKDYPYSKLFDHMSDEHGLTLTDTELGDIIHIARQNTKQCPTFTK